MKGDKEKVDEVEYLSLTLDPYEARVLQHFLAKNKHRAMTHLPGAPLDQRWSERERELMEELKEMGIDTSKPAYDIISEVDYTLADFTGSFDIHLTVKATPRGKDKTELEIAVDEAKDLKHRLSYWRSSFMRMASAFLHSEIHTIRDIIDASPRMKDDTLNDNQIDIRVQFDEKEVTQITDLHLAAETVAEALDLQFTDISIKGRILILQYLQEGYLAEAESNV